MGYLIRQDYKSLIQTDNLAQIIGSDYTLLTKAEQAALSEVKSYLVQKYNVDREFVDTALFTHSATYYPSSRFYLDADAYLATAVYDTNALVVYNNVVYINITPIATPEAWNGSKWASCGDRYAIFHIDMEQDAEPSTEWDYYTEYEAGEFVWFGNKVYEAITTNTALQPDENPNQWGAGVAWSVPASDLPDGNAVFVAEDNRNQQMVNYMIDVVLYHLHSRIAPRNIPDIRVKRYDDSIAWLKQCAKGDHLTADIPLIQPKQGMRNRYGGALPKQNNSF